MIFVCSDSTDFSTTHVIKWINYLGGSYIRFNENDKIRFLKTIGLTDFLFELQTETSKKIFKFSEIKSYWYRRGGMSPNFDRVENHTPYSKDINHYLSNEYFAVSDFMENLLESKTAHRIGKRSFNLINKLNLLQKASELQLDVPDTLITTSKADLLEFYIKNKTRGIITKDAHHPLTINFSKTELGVFYTSEVLLSHITCLPESFFLTKFQEKLDKDFEIRTFFLNDKTYSVAIFSQSDSKTKLDFRRYNFTKPNRTPPYNLPDIVKLKLLRLMKNIGLNSGSIDIVYTKDERFVFLEVNPIGQFYQVSYPGNYNIEKVIADYLINGI